MLALAGSCLTGAGGTPVGGGGGGDPPLVYSKVTAVWAEQL